jgi:hypothetical protein
MSTTYPNPYTIARQYFVHKESHEHLTADQFQRRYELAVHFEGPQREEIPDWTSVIRDEARRSAIGWLWGVVPECRTMGQILTLCRAAKTELNPFCRADERDEFEREFYFEVDSRLTVLIAQVINARRAL